jgi:hypothetical protein
VQVANQEAKVATQRNSATFSEIIAIGASGSFVFFQLLRTACDFCSIKLLVIFLLKLADSSQNDWFQLLNESAMLL